MTHLRQTLSILAVAGLLLAACGAPAAPTPAPTATPAGPAPTPAAKGDHVDVPGTPLSFRLPSGWAPGEQEWTWSPPDAAGGDRHIGIAWKPAQAGTEPESLLPAGAVVTNRSVGPTLKWGTASTYLVQVLAAGGQGEVQAYQTHVIVRASDIFYDFYATAPTQDELAATAPGLNTALKSVSLPEFPTDQ